MFTTRRWILGALALAIAAGSCFSEDAEPAKFYRLDFVIKEMEGVKTLNTRSYSMVVSAASAGNFRSEIRAGSKVRYSTGGTSGVTYQLLDVGTNIDAYAIKEIENRLSLNVKVEISSIPAGASDPAGPAVIRQNTWGSAAVVPLRKPTLLFSSDNMESKGQMQVELTATPLP